jgi:hypothetical protein
MTGTSWAIPAEGDVVDPGRAQAPRAAILRAFGAEIFAAGSSRRSVRYSKAAAVGKGHAEEPRSAVRRGSQLFDLEPPV